MRDEAIPTVQPSTVQPPTVLRLPLLVRLGASVLLGLLLVVLVTTIVGPAVAGRADAPGTMPSVTAVVVSIAAAAVLVGCWRVRLSATSRAVTRVTLFSDARTITLTDARRIEVSTALAEGPEETLTPVRGPTAGSIVPIIVLTGRGESRITSRENRREAITLLPTLLAWSRERPELVKDAHTLRFLTAFGRANP